MSSSSFFSLKDVKNTNMQNKIISIWIVKIIKPKVFKKKAKKTIIIVDLKKTVNLKTAIIEKEWINNLNKDIFEGPKYRVPRKEFISLKKDIYFLSVPE